MDRDFWQRRYRAFVSYAHEDKAIAEGVAAFLARLHGGAVWFDRRQLTGASAIAAEIARHMPDCRAAVLLLSQHWHLSDWCSQELEQALDQQPRTHGGFRLVVIKIGNCDIPRELQRLLYFELGPSGFDGEAAQKLVDALHPLPRGGVLQDIRATYLSAGWRAEETRLNLKVAEQMRDCRLDPVGDAPSHPEYDDKRVNRLIGGCGAFVAVVPHRGKGTTSSYILEEIDQARTAGLPLLVLVEEGVEWQAPADVPSVTVSRGKIGDQSQFEAIKEAMQALSERWRGKDRREYVFVGHVFDKPQTARAQTIARVIESASGVPCITGDGLGQDPQPKVIELIRRSRMSLFDLSVDDKSDTGLANVHIEAGIALATGVPIGLLKEGPRGEDLPFMLAHNNEIRPFENRLDLVVEAYNMGYAIRRSVYL